LEIGNSTEASGLGNKTDGMDVGATGNCLGVIGINVIGPGVGARGIRGISIGLDAEGSGTGVVGDRMSGSR